MTFYASLTHLGSSYRPIYQSEICKAPLYTICLGAITELRQWVCKQKWF